MSSTIVTVNPATGAPLATYQAMTQAEINAALDAAAAAQRRWAAQDFAVRAEILRTAAALLRERDDERHCWSPARWASRWPKPGPRCTSAPTGWSSTPNTPRPSWPTRSMRRPQTAAGCPMSRSGWCWR